MEPSAEKNQQASPQTKENADFGEHTASSPTDAATYVVNFYQEATGATPPFEQAGAIARSFPTEQRQTAIQMMRDELQTRGVPTDHADDFQVTVDYDALQRRLRKEVINAPNEWIRDKVDEYQGNASSIVDMISDPSFLKNDQDRNTIRDLFVSAIRRVRPDVTLPTDLTELSALYKTTLEEYQEERKRDIEQEKAVEGVKREELHQRYAANEAMYTEAQKGLEQSVEKVAGMFDTLVKYAIANGANPEIFAHIPKVCNPKMFTPIAMEGGLLGTVNALGIVEINSHSATDAAVVAHEATHRAQRLASGNIGREEIAELYGIHMLKDEVDTHSDRYHGLSHDEREKKGQVDKEVVVVACKKVLEGLTDWAVEKAKQLQTEHQGSSIIPADRPQNYPDQIALINVIKRSIQQQGDLSSEETDARILTAALTGDFKYLIGQVDKATLKSLLDATPIPPELEDKYKAQVGDL